MIKIKDNVGQWSMGTLLPRKRTKHACAVVGDKIYCIGGLDDQGQYVEQIDIYDTTTDTWSIGADMLRPRTYIESIVFETKIYCVGGTPPNYTGNQAFLDVYDTQMNTWSSLPSAPQPLYYACAALHGNRIYCTGGRKEILIYNIGGNTWSLGSSISFPYSRNIPSPVQEWNHHLYSLNVYGNGYVAIYDFENNSWTFHTKDFETFPLYSDPHAVKYDDKIWFYAAFFEDRENMRLMYYDPAKDNSYACDRNNIASGKYSWAGMASVGNKIYLMGGEDESGCTNEVNIFTIGCLDSYTITEYYHDQNGQELRTKTEQIVEKFGNYQSVAPVIPGYTYVGYKLNEGEIQQKSTFSISNIQDDHSVVLIYSIGEPPVHTNQCCCPKVEVKFSACLNHKSLLDKIANIIQGEDCHCNCDLSEM